MCKLVPYLKKETSYNIHVVDGLPKCCKKSRFENFTGHTKHDFSILFLEAAKGYLKFEQCCVLLKLLIYSNLSVPVTTLTVMTYGNLDERTDSYSFSYEKGFNYALSCNGNKS